MHIYIFPNKPSIFISVNTELYNHNQSINHTLKEGKRNKQAHLCKTLFNTIYQKRQTRSSYLLLQAHEVKQI